MSVHIEKWPVTYQGVVAFLESRKRSTLAVEELSKNGMTERERESASIDLRAAQIYNENIDATLLAFKQRFRRSA